MENKMHVKTEESIDKYLYENRNEIKFMTSDSSDALVSLAGNPFSTATNVNNVKVETALSIESSEIVPVIPEVTDDLINLYDDYNIYLLNEEIVCTEPFTYENEVATNSQLASATCSTSETIIYEENSHSQYLIDEDDNEEADLNRRILNLTEECSSSLIIEAKDLFQCELCNTYCNNQSEWIDHHKLHNIWICFECDTKYDTEIKLTEHTAKFHIISSNVTESSQEADLNELNRKPHVCKFCNVRFAREKALISHENIHKNQYNKSHQFTCKNCKEVFSKQQTLNEHLTICSVNYLSLSPTKTIVKPKRNSKKRRKQQVPMEICETNMKGNGLHMNKATNYKISCPECDKMFPTKQKMYRHKWIHRKKAFSCEICAMSFLLRIELDKHRLCEHAEQKKYMCGECGKNFASRQGLWEHNRLHTTNNQVPYNCSQCGKNFTSRQGYLIHLRTHTGEKPFTCTYCDKSFRDGGTLRKHLRIHTGERPHKCPLCEKSFNQKVVMREHIRWVHASNIAEYPEPAPYSCALCSLKTILMDREELCTHIVKHSDQIATIMKSIKETGDSEDNDTESDSSDSLVIDQPANGMKCDRRVIKKNRKLLNRLLKRQKKSEFTQKKSISSENDNKESKHEDSKNKFSLNLQNTELRCDICKVNCNVKDIFCDHILMQIIG